MWFVVRSSKYFRRRFRPLEFWRNETVVYGRRKSGTFPTVVDVQHAGDLEHNKKLQEQKEAFKVRVCVCYVLRARFAAS